MNRKAIEALYDGYCAETANNIALHLPALRALAARDGVKTIVEFGTQYGRSATAFLLGLKRDPDSLLQGDYPQVVSYDLFATTEAKALASLAMEWWDYRIENTRTANIPKCDLLFVDSFHSYVQVKAELDSAADKVSQYLVFHDTITFGTVAAKDNHGYISWEYVRGQTVPPECFGVRLAVDELMIRDPSWRIISHNPHSHGLLVLEREQKETYEQAVAADKRNTRNLKKK